MAQAIIIGGGFAGCASAIAAAQAGYEVTLVEKETFLFAMSSSRNAAIARCYEADPYVSLLLKEGVNKLVSLATNSDYDILCGGGLFIKPLEVDYQIEMSDSSHNKIEECKLTLPGGLNISGYFLPQNRIVNLSELQRYFIDQMKKLGVKVFCDSLVTEIKADNNRIVKVEILHPPNAQKDIVSIATNDILINASGSHVAALLNDNDLTTPPFVPYKRHLFWMQGEGSFDESRTIWDETNDYYFRKESNGLLATHCDQIATEPNDYAEEPNARDLFSEATSRAFPFLADFKIKKSWACLRTFSSDNRPVIGFDPNISNLFWLAGLGGRGVSASLALISACQKRLQIGIDENESEFTNPFSAFRF